MFGVDLSVLTARELSTLYNDLDGQMKRVTGTWGWPVLNTPVTESIWGFFLALSSEMSAREVEEEEIPEWVWDVDGGGLTGYVTNHSNRAY